MLSRRCADVQLLEQALERLVARGIVEVAARLEDRHDVVGDRHAAEDRGFLRQVADAAPRARVHRQRRDVLAVELDARRRRRARARRSCRRRWSCRRRSGRAGRRPRRSRSRATARRRPCACGSSSRARGREFAHGCGLRLVGLPALRRGWIVITTGSSRDRRAGSPCCRRASRR